MKRGKQCLIIIVDSKLSGYTSKTFIEQQAKKPKLLEIPLDTSVIMFHWVMIDIEGHCRLPVFTCICCSDENYEAIERISRRLWHVCSEENIISIITEYKKDYEITLSKTWMFLFLTTVEMFCLSVSFTQDTV